MEKKILKDRDETENMLEHDKSKGLIVRSSAIAHLFDTSTAAAGQGQA